MRKNFLDIRNGEMNKRNKCENFFDCFFINFCFVYRFFIRATPPEIKITLGAFDRCFIDVSSVNVSVEEVIRYPEFISETHAHDLALIRLSHPVSFSKRIMPVCLSNPKSTYLGQVGTMVGWIESDSDNSKPSCLPRKLGLPILDGEKCLKSKVEPSYYHDDSGCIGIVGGNSIVCNVRIIS